MASKGRWIEDLVGSYKTQINNLEAEIVTTYKSKIEDLKDVMIEELKLEFEKIGFKIYAQWIKKYDSFEDLADFSLNEIFLTKKDDIWYYIEVYGNYIHINNKTFKKFATIDLSKVKSSIPTIALEELGYVYYKDTNQIKLVNKDSCKYSYIYQDYHHRDFSRKYKLDLFLNKKNENENENGKV